MAVSSYKGVTDSKGLVIKKSHKEYETFTSTK